MTGAVVSPSIAALVKRPWQSRRHVPRRWCSAADRAFGPRFPIFMSSKHDSTINCAGTGFHPPPPKHSRRPPTETFLAYPPPFVFFLVLPRVVSSYRCVETGAVCRTDRSKHFNTHRSVISTRLWPGGLRAESRPALDSRETRQRRWGRGRTVGSLQSIS